MSSFVLLNRNPLSEAGSNLMSTITLTDEFGSTADITQIKYLWIPHPGDVPKSDIFAQYMLALLSEKIIIYSNLNGFIIVERDRSTAPETNAGLNNTWTRLAVMYIDSSMPNIMEGTYVIRSGASGKSVWSGPSDPNGSIVAAQGEFFINTSSGTIFGPKSSMEPKVWPTTGLSLVGAAGINGSAVLSGTGAPDASLGSVGDLYYDTTNRIFYPPKVTPNAWPTGTSLTTIFNSAAAPANSVGTIGDFHWNTSTRTWTGPKVSTSTWTGAGTFSFNTILTGTATPPAASVGVNGDYYINSTTRLMYGPKASGAWPAGVLMSTTDANRTFVYASSGTTTGQFTYTPGTYSSPAAGVPGSLVVSITDTRSRALTNYLTSMNGREITLMKDDCTREVTFSIINVTIASNLATFSVFPAGKYAIVSGSLTLVDAGYGMPVTALTTDKVINGVNPFVAGERWVFSVTRLNRYVEISFLNNTTKLSIAASALSTLTAPSTAPSVTTNVPMIWYYSNTGGALTTHYRGNTDIYEWSMSFSLAGEASLLNSTLITVTMAELASPYTGTPTSIGTTRTMYTGPGVEICLAFGGVAVFKKDFRYYVRFSGTTNLGIFVSEGTLHLRSVDNGMVVV